MTNPYDAMVFGGMYYCAKQINILILAGEVERLTEQREMTSRQIHHADLSEEMDPQFCPLPSYSAFQLMSRPLSPSLSAITQAGLRKEGMFCIWTGCHLNQNQAGSDFIQYFILRHRVWTLFKS